MRTIICEQPDQWLVTETEPPSGELKPGEAIVRICRIGICGTDLHAFKGNQPFFQYPRILGHELSGTIEQIAVPNEQGLQAGDQVAVIPYLACGACIACRSGRTNCCTSMQVLGVHVDGGMRELLSVPAKQLLAVNDLTLEQAATVEPLAIGAHAVRRSGLQAGETALVIGGGPIGLGVMAIAKALGATVIAMDVNEDRLQFCRSWAGVDHTLNALGDNPLEELAALTGGELAPVVFDATGNAKSMMNAFGYTAHGGRLVYVGLVRADITFNDPEFHKRELTLLASRNALPEDFDTVLSLLRSGAINVDAYITHRASFDEMTEHFPSWLDPKTGVIKAMVEL